ncbi:MAG: hypothetical protein K5851_07785 [Lachnospiraceae bacterium]|nr:hypothetical protein [Lachnospiraceae bacterium]
MKATTFKSLIVSLLFVIFTLIDLWFIMPNIMDKSPEILRLFKMLSLMSLVGATIYFDDFYKNLIHK